MSFGDSFRQAYNQILYRIVTLIFWALSNFYFREVLEKGSHRIPSNGPVILVAAPHANQFADSTVIFCTCLRRVRMSMAAKSMVRGFPGFFARKLNTIPIERLIDFAKKGIGKVRPDKENPLCIMGIGTEFTKQFSPQSTSIIISLPPETFTAVVERVESDTLLFLKQTFPGTIETKLYTSEPVPFKVAPVVDQSRMYDQVFKALEAGEGLVVFPEGGSHDRSQILSLKAGVTLMALGAIARDPDLKLAIIPCGLNYFNPDRFRSRAMVEYGEPFQIDSKLVELFKKGGDFRKEACAKLLDLIYSKLCLVTINVPDYETLEIIQTLRRLYQPSSQELSPFELLEVTRRITKGYLEFKDDPRMVKLQESILKYNKLLKDLQLCDFQVKAVEFNFFKAILVLMHQSSILFIYCLVILPGTLLNLPAILIIDYISKRKAALAVASSMVKIRGRDVITSWRTVIGVSLLPFLYILYSIPLAYELRCKNFSIIQTSIIFSAMVIFILPWLLYITVLGAERGYKIFLSIQPLWYSIIKPRHMKALYKFRTCLKRETICLIDDYGPKLFKNFEEERIIPFRSKYNSESEEDADDTTFL